jgi:hypothetical protein
MAKARDKEAGGREIYAAREPFMANVDGVIQRHGPTILVREGHRVLELYPDMFEPVRVQFDVEQATAAPGERRER